MPAWRRVWVAAALAGLIAATAAPVASAGEPEAFRLREVGEFLPVVTLEDLAGEGHALGTPGAGPSVLFFWSVFCPNCKEAIPGLVELHKAWGGRGLQVWAINVDGDRFSNAVQSYVREMDLPFPVVYDRLEGELLVAADPLGVTKTPTLYLAGPDGRIALRQVIEMDFAPVAQALERISP